MWTSLARVVVFVLCLAAATGRAAAQAPSPEDTLTAFSAVQRAVRAWGVIPESEKLPVPAGACVMLKLRGEVVGRGIAWNVGAGEQPRGGVIREALAAAMKQAEPRLGVSNDAMRDEAIKEVARGILIGVELAGPLSAIEPGTWEEAEASLRPGLDGVAVRAGNGKGEVVAVFPSQMMLTNTLPHRALGGAVAQCLGEGGAAAALDEPKKVREKHGVRMYSFRVQHAVQPSSSESGIVLYRGHRLIPPSEFPTSAVLRKMRDSLALHLLARIQAALNAKLRDQVVSGEAAVSRLLAAYAIMSWLSSNHELPELTKQSWARLVNMVYFDERSEEPVAQALATLVGERVPAGVEFRYGGDAQPPFIDEYRRTTKGRFAPDAPTIDRIDVSLRPVVIHAAVAFSSNAGPDDPIIKGTGRAIDDVFTTAGESRVVSLLPWLGWAEVEHERAARPEVAKHADLRHAITFRRVREQVWKHQLTPTQATDDTLDMIGGIVFTAGVGEGSGNPYPTWQCVRPLAFIATMLGDPRLTESGERMKDIPNLMLAMRYLRQLQVDDASAWMYPNPELAKGGIRAAVWDNSQPTDATSLTLLCVIELLNSLDRLAAQPQPPSPQAPATPATK